MNESWQAWEEGTYKSRSKKLLEGNIFEKGDKISHLHLLLQYSKTV